VKTSKVIFKLLFQESMVITPMETTHNLHNRRNHGLKIQVS